MLLARLGWFAGLEGHRRLHLKFKAKRNCVDGNAFSGWRHGVAKKRAIGGGSSHAPHSVLHAQRWRAFVVRKMLPSSGAENVVLITICAPFVD